MTRHFSYVYQHYSTNKLHRRLRIRELYATCIMKSEARRSYCYGLPAMFKSLGPLFTEWTDILLQDLVGTRSREIRAYTFPIARKFDGHLNHCNIKSRAFETSRDLAVRHLIAYWIEALNDTSTMWWFIINLANIILKYPVWEWRPIDRCIHLAFLEHNACLSRNIYREIYILRNLPCIFEKCIPYLQFINRRL